MKITVVSVPYIILKITAQLYSKTASPDKGGKVKNKHLAFVDSCQQSFFLHNSSKKNGVPLRFEQDNGVLHVRWV